MSNEVKHEFLSIKLVEKNGKTFFEVESTNPEIVNILKSMSNEEKLKLVEMIKKEVFKEVQLEKMKKLSEEIFEETNRIFREIDKMFKALEQQVNEVLEIPENIMEKITGILMRELAKKKEYWKII